jgi:hypothetical protein
MPSPEDAGSPRPDAGSTESDAGPSDDAGPGIWGACVGANPVPFSAEQACQKCVRDNCCEQLTACGADPACIGIRECSHSMTCWPEYGEGLGVSARIGACTARSCSQACGRDQCSGGYLSFLPAACESCMKSTCCEAIQQATDSLAYWDYYRCVTPCETNECAAACAEQHPEGAALQQPISVCATITCAEGCGADYFPPPPHGEDDAGT